MLHLKSPSKSAVRLAKLHILAHQCKIPKKIEIILASNCETKNVSPTFDKCQNVRRLGYVSLDSNEQTDFQARELKSIDIAYENVCFVKLVIRQCHVNAFNVHNQVGLIAINMLGEVEGEQGCGTSSIQKGVSYNKKGEQDHKMVHINNPNNEARANSMQETPQFLLSSAPKIALDSSLLTRIEKLETVKRNMAAAEDFENAARLKDILTNVHNLFEAFIKIEEQMKVAAFEENYPVASRLKIQRDKAKRIALESLNDAEQNTFQHYQGGNMSSTNEKVSQSPKREKIPLEAIEDDQDVLSTSNKDDKTSQAHCASPQNLATDSDQMSCDSTLTENPDDVSENKSDHGGEDHPLEGISGYQELPVPEELDATGKDASTDIIQNIESILGSYLARCFFSKNWSLREAAVMKTSILIPKMVQDFGFQNCAPVLCLLLERAMNDRIVHVLLTSLILLDDCISQFEMVGLSQKEVIQLLGKKTIQTVIGKLGDSKKSIVEGCETILMSMALSNCIGVSYIGYLLTKPFQAKDLKSGKAVSARFRFLQRLVEVFGEDAGEANHILVFIKGKKTNFDKKKYRPHEVEYVE